MLEKFEFKTDRANLPSVPGWLYRTLWKINSPSFKQFTLWVSNCSSAVDLRAAMCGDDWKTVDAYLFVWSKFKSSFEVVFRMEFEGCEALTIKKFIRKRFRRCKNLIPDVMDAAEFFVVKLDQQRIFQIPCSGTSFVFLLFDGTLGIFQTRVTLAQHSIVRAINL